MAQRAASLDSTSLWLDISDLLPTRKITVLVGSVSLIIVLLGSLQPLIDGFEAGSVGNVENNHYHVRSVVAVLQHALKPLIA